MNYLVIVLLLMASVYPFTYVKYVWSKKNYIGALGMVFITLVSVLFPAYVLLVR